MTSCQQLADASALTKPLLRAFVALCIFSSASAFATQIQGQVQGANAPIDGATVTLWAASADAARQLTQTQSDASGRFTLSADGNGADLYLVAKGGHAAAGKVNMDNPAVAMITVLGTAPPANVVINEMTTVASGWTHNQFLNGTAVKGSALSLRIAASNMPNFVDLETGGWGAVIQDPLNSNQTPTTANSQPSPMRCRAASRW